MNLIVWRQKKQLKRLISQKKRMKSLTPNYENWRRLKCHEKMSLHEPKKPQNPQMNGLKMRSLS
jgi:hypothetical protein